MESSESIKATKAIEFTNPEETPTTPKPKRKRPLKRILVRWNDNLDKQVLLTIQWACSEVGLKIPWDLVARQMGPDFTEGAIVQHLAKLRGNMEKNKIDVPPHLKRGVVAKEPSKIYATPKKRTAPEFNQQEISPPEIVQPMLSSALPAEAKGKEGRKPAKKVGKGKRKTIMKEPTSSIDPDLVSDSDGEYGPTKKRRRVSGKQSKEKPKGKRIRAKKPLLYTPNASRFADEDDLLLDPNGTSFADVQQSVEVNEPIKTRGKKKNYAELVVESSDEEHEEDAGPAAVTEEREVSPHTLVSNQGELQSLMDINAYNTVFNNQPDFNGLNFQNPFLPEIAPVYMGGLPQALPHQHSFASTSTNSTMDNTYIQVPTNNMLRALYNASVAGPMNWQSPDPSIEAFAAMNNFVVNPATFPTMEPDVIDNQMNYIFGMQDMDNTGQLPLDSDDTLPTPALPLLPEDENFANNNNEKFDQIINDFETDFDAAHGDNEDMFQSFTDPDDF